MSVRKLKLDSIIAQNKTLNKVKKTKKKVIFLKYRTSDVKLIDETKIQHGLQLLLRNVYRILEHLHGSDVDDVISSKKD